METEFPHIRYAFLEERLLALEAEWPESPLRALLAPVVVTSSRVLEARAAEDYYFLRDHPGLGIEDRVYFTKIFLHFLSQRFATKDANQLKAMIKELVPLEKTVVYREMIEIGREEGREEGREKGRKEGRETGRKEGFRLALERLIASGMTETEAHRVLGPEPD
jgi:flagellar biosynthesis/type III secretory pathway protein FliH